MQSNTKNKLAGNKINTYNNTEARQYKKNNNTKPIRQNNTKKQYCKAIPKNNTDNKKNNNKNNTSNQYKNKHNTEHNTKNNNTKTKHD